jgi:hypothetical protein
VQDDAASSPLDPAFLAGLEDLPLDELRRRRGLATQRETAQSYVRRLVQGPLDILVAEVERRRSGGRAGDVSDLVDRLPEILGEQIHAPGPGRLPELIDPGEVDEELVARIDATVTTEELADPAALPAERIETIVAELGALEREISASRRHLQRVVDTIKAEMVRRYRDGEATVDELV